MELRIHNHCQSIFKYKTIIKMHQLWVFATTPLQYMLIRKCNCRPELRFICNHAHDIDYPCERIFVWTRNSRQWSRQDSHHISKIKFDIISLM
jgi:hypothetical protein